MTDLSRRGFLGAILAAAVAPAIIRTPGLIMPVKPILDLRPMNPDYLDGLDRLQRALCEPILVRAEHLLPPYSGPVIARLDPPPRPFRHPDLVALLDEARAKLIAEERFGTFVPGMAVSA